MDNARYTVLLKSLMEHPETYGKIQQALSTYPLYAEKSPGFRESYIPNREQINRKLLNLYKYREIAFETPGRFFDELEISMNEIMPYYNQLFQSVEIMNNIEDIFGNVDVEEKFTETRDGNSYGKSEIENNGTQSKNSTSKNVTSATDEQRTTSNMGDDSKAVQSGTPQGEINITAKNIDNIPYADQVNWNQNNASSTSESNGKNDAESETNNTETQSNNDNSITDTSNTEHQTITHEYTKKGNQGVNTYAHDIIEYRQTMLNIEQQIINDPRIKDLFLMIF